MRFLKFAVLAALFVVPVSTVDAGVFGSSFLRVTGITILKNGGAANPADLLTFADTTDSSTFVDLNAVQAFDFDRPGFDALRSVVGTDPGGENDFTQYAGTTGLDYSSADTDGSGNLFTGANVDTLAEMEVTAQSLGFAEGDVSGNISVRFQVAGAGSYSIRYDGFVNQFAESIAPPVNTGVLVDSQFRVQINGGNVSLNDLNTDLSNTFSVTNGTNSYTKTVLNYNTASVNLVAGIEYLLTIKQITTVTLFAVPEPGTMLSFVGLCAIGIGRRRRKA